MCGIAGQLVWSDEGAPRELDVRRMLAAIRHRGPDQFGVYIDDHVGLGNARLSIIDVAHGQQPIGTEDGRFWIVYNGEIFNHAELREELEAEGERFATHTDTEVLLRLYRRRGAECLQRINGQFAVAIWDTIDRRLFLARDRLGIRPLFLARRAGGILFASEIKALAAGARIKLEIDPVALDQIITGWSCLPPRTPFLGVEQLAPGHFAVCADGRVDVHRYWSPGFDSTSDTCSPRSDESYVEEFGDLLADATRLRLIADVPVGGYLSGGLDSSLVAALARRHATGRFDTFSIAFTDTAFDESEHQQRMAKFLGTEHQVVEATHRDIAEVFPEVVWHCESPLLRTAPAPMFLLSRLVNRSGYKVVLTGEGADEFFGGYDLFKEAKIRHFWSREPQSLRRPKLFARIYPDLPGLGSLSPRYLAAFFGHRFTETDAVDYSHAVRWHNTRRLRRFLAPEMLNRIEASARPYLDEVPFPPGFARWPVLDRAQYLEIATFLSTYLLSSQGDRVAMAHSVEGRFPFLDYRLSEFCRRLPQRLRLRVLRDKWIVRKFASALLPSEIWDRPKKPYRAPIHRSFFAPGSPEYVRQILSPEALRESGIFNPAAVASLVARIDSGGPVGETDDMAVAAILSTQLLHGSFIREVRTLPPLGPADDVLVVDRRSSRSAA